MAGRKSVDDWDHFRFFLAVARKGTLSAAAAHLGTEHTTVARRIQALEESLNTRLFLKTNAGYELTAAGENVLSTAEGMESSFLSAKALAGLGAQTVAGTVRVGAPDGFGSMFVAPRLHALTGAHPELSVELLATARVFSLSKREADIAISLSMPRQSRVVSRRLTDYRLHLYAAKSSLKKTSPIRTKEDVRRHRFVGYIEDLLFAPELNYLNAVGGNIEAQIRSTNLLAQVHATLSGAGICVLPNFVAAGHPQLVPVLPGEVSVTRSFYMHIHEDNRNAAHIREVATFISSEVERNQSLFLQFPRK